MHAGAMPFCRVRQGGESVPVSVHRHVPANHLAFTIRQDTEWDPEDHLGSRSEALAGHPDFLVWSGEEGHTEVVAVGEGDLAWVFVMWELKGLDGIPDCASTSEVALDQPPEPSLLLPMELFWIDLRQRGVSQWGSLDAGCCFIQLALEHQELHGLIWEDRSGFELVLVRLQFVKRNHGLMSSGDFGGQGAELSE